MTVQSIYYPQVAARRALDLFAGAANGPSIAKLYASNTPYLATRVIGDYTEASFAGYAQFGPLAWPLSATNGSGKAETSGPTPTFTYTAGAGTATVFGMLLCDSAGTTLLGVVPFLVPFVFSPANNVLTLAPALTEVSEL
jgi:hypothetical protein